jgi:allophanate hydrolase subunit 2
MGSRSTFVRAGIGGYHGRALRKGDIVELGEARPLSRLAEGFVCPPDIRPLYDREGLVFAMAGPQIDAFTESGVETFFNGTFTVTSEIDRMGYRLDGPEIKHKNGADTVSDGITPGAVQVPGDGKPIVMMSDCQTTGGYVKIAVLSSWSAASLARRMPGDQVRFKRVTEEEAVRYLKKFEGDLRRLDEMRATYRSRRGV